jgi:hypothetical protein
MKILLLLCDRVLPFLALALIAVGLWYIYAPAAPLALGLLLWIDLHRKDPTP